MSESQKTMLSEETLIFLCGQATCALYWLHSRGLVHRDIKPSNFCITKNGNLKLIDFEFMVRMAYGEKHNGRGGTEGYVSVPLCNTCTNIAALSR